MIMTRMASKLSRASFDHPESEAETGISERTYIMHSQMVEQVRRCIRVSTFSDRTKLILIVIPLMVAW
jgi:hypothetical protein